MSLANKFLPVSVLLCLLISAQLISVSWAKKGSGSNGGGGWNSKQSCTFDPAQNFNATALYVWPNRTEFTYPQTPSGFTLNSTSGGLRIVCPGGEIFANGKGANLSAATAECVGGPTVKLTDTYVYSPLQGIGCTGVKGPTAQLTKKLASNGKKIAEIGYEISLIEFLAVVDEIAVSSFKSGYIPRWAHHKIVTSTVEEKSKPKDVGLKSGALAAKVPFAEVYDAAKQRKQILQLYGNDTELVNKYIPADGKQYFVASRLIKPDDLYYEVERSASHLYETTIPVWSSVDSGNWKLVSKAVRDLVPKTSTTSPVSDVDVWSGSYLDLYLPNSAGKNVYVQLPHGLKAAEFLFKYVHDEANKRGIVFVTVNNPHLTEANDKNVICEPLPGCVKKYPDFAKFEKGYTYCCNLKDFKSQAEKLGLPVVEDAAAFL